MSSDSKLGSALKDAALQNINEDIREINTNLENISKNIPSYVKEEVENIKHDINSLSLALKQIPNQFDLDFSRKINRVLDLVADIEEKTSQKQKLLTTDLEKHLSNYVDNINSKLAKEVKNNFIIKDSKLFITIFITALLGGLLGASIVAVALIYLS